MTTVDEVAPLTQEAETPTPDQDKKPAKTTRTRKPKKTDEAVVEATAESTAEPTNGHGNGQTATADAAPSSDLLTEWDRGVTLTAESDPAETAGSSESVATETSVPAAPAATKPRVVRAAATRAATPRRSRKDAAVEETAAPVAEAEVTVPDVAQVPVAPVAAVEEKSAPVVARPAPVDDNAAPSFASLGLSESLLKSITAVGYEEPTPIQLMTIPVLLSGRDVIAQAQTGSGKTAAFGLPIIDQIDSQDRHVQALILAPTRELAIQVAEALHKYGRHKEVETLPIYGGQPYERQFRGLSRGVQIVVGTPGRVMDHMRRGTLNLDNIRFFVLDEADEMLDMGFVDDIEWILEQAPATRQSALFSATMPPRIAALARKYLNNAERLTIVGTQMTVPETHQTAYEVPKARKIDALTRILDAETPSLAMIFARTKIGVDELGEALLARGYQAETLHGDLSQAQRDRVMRRFRSGQADILIATDVAARGLDVPDVSHVINYDIPESAEAYVHRIGRTGRAGRSGEAITLVTNRETRWLKQIERVIKARIEIKRLPTMSDVAERRREVLKNQIVNALQAEENFSQYLPVISDLAEDHDASAIAAAILKLYADETGRGAPSAEALAEDVAAVSAPAPVMRGEVGMTRLALNLGRNLSIRPQDIVGAIANEANIPGRSIGAIDIYDAYTFVDVPTEFAERVIEAIQRSGIKGRTVNAEVAQPGQGRPPREEGRGGFDRGGRDGGFDRNRGGFDRNRGGGDRRGGFGGPPRFDRDQPREGNFGGAPRFDRDSAPPRQFERNDAPRRDFDRSDRPAPARFDRGSEPNGNVRTDPPSFNRDNDRSGPPPRFSNPREDGPRRFERNDRGTRGPSGGRRDF